MKALILSPHMKAVSISDRRRNLRLDELQDLLCRKDCTLKKLYLSGVSILLPESHRYGSIVQNVSVTSLSIRSGALSERRKISKVLGLFKSLEELNLSSNSITELSFLDPFFDGDTSRLKSLNVSCNNIDEEEIKIFVEKLRKIRGLKHLAIQDQNDSDLSSSLCTTLVDALRHNTDLELIDIEQVFDHLPLDLNRGGRRVFESQQPFPTNLLPRVLERASKVSYYACEDDRWGDPTDKTAIADVVFWMVHRIVPQLN